MPQCSFSRAFKAVRARCRRTIALFGVMLMAGFVADAFGLPVAMWLVAALTLASGVVVAVRMTETTRLSATKNPATIEAQEVNAAQTR